MLRDDDGVGGKERREREDEGRQEGKERCRKANEGGRENIEVKKEKNMR